MRIQNNFLKNINIVLLCNHIRQRIPFALGKEFVPMHVKVVDTSALVVSGRNLDYTSECRELYIAWNGTGYYLVDVDQYSIMGNTVEETYDTLINYIESITQAFSA